MGIVIRGGHPFRDDYGTLSTAAGNPAITRQFAVENQADMESLFNSVGPAPDAGAQVKIMRWPASLRLGHTRVLTGKAIQISGSGISLLLSHSVRDGEIGLLRVDAFIAGNPVILQTRVSVVCCACVGMDGFRISLRFQDLDADAMSALEALLHAR